MDKRFKFPKKKIPIYLVARKKIKDSRGFFERLYCKKEFYTLLKNKDIKQINRAYTRTKSTIRGMHYQVGGNSEDKIVNHLNKIKKNKIIIIVSHRLNAMKYCDKIYEIENGTLK